MVLTHSNPASAILPKQYLSTLLLVLPLALLLADPCPLQAGTSASQPYAKDVRSAESVSCCITTNSPGSAHTP